jgi:hypothetical protein
VILPDVNVLVNAFRADARDHQPCHAWLSGIVTGEARYAISPQVLSGVIRVATHPRVFARPSDTADAVRFCKVLLDQPHCEVVVPGERHWSILQRLLTATRVRGNLVSDAWFAALAIESGCEWITLDRDYGKFPGLRWRRPEGC